MTVAAVLAEHALPVNPAVRLARVSRAVHRAALVSNVVTMVAAARVVRAQWARAVTLSEYAIMIARRVVLVSSAVMMVAVALAACALVGRAVACLACVNLFVIRTAAVKIVVKMVVAVPAELVVQGRPVSKAIAA